MEILGENVLIRGKAIGPWLWKVYLVLGSFLVLCSCTAQGKGYPFHGTTATMTFCPSTWEQIATDWKTFNNKQKKNFPQLDVFLFIILFTEMKK